MKGPVVAVSVSLMLDATPGALSVAGGFGFRRRKRWYLII